MMMPSPQRERGPEGTLSVGVHQEAGDHIDCWIVFTAAMQASSLP